MTRTLLNSATETERALPLFSNLQGELPGENVTLNAETAISTIDANVLRLRAENPGSRNFKFEVSTYAHQQKVLLQPENQRYRDLLDRVINFFETI